MKNFLVVVCICVSSFYGLNSEAGLLYSYHRLAIKDLDQMSKLIKEKIKESKAAAGNKTIPLKEALQAVFSRPNDDFLIEKILSPLKNELDDQEAWEKTVKALVKESIGALKNPKAFKPEALVTYSIFLENFIAEMKPKVSNDFEKSVYQQIRDAKIELTKEAIHERKLRMMKDGVSPSLLADLVLKDLAESEKKAKTEPAKLNSTSEN